MADKFVFSMWTYNDIKEFTPDEVDVWADCGLNIPMGVGVKYKIRPRLNVGFEWTFRFTTCDKLDDSGHRTKLDDPLGVQSGTFKNKDCYTMALIMLTYDISPKYRKCNN